MTGIKLFDSNLNVIKGNYLADLNLMELPEYPTRRPYKSQVTPLTLQSEERRLETQT